MIAKITRGSGFRGALNYGFNEGKKAIEGKEAELIGGNMNGTTAKELAAEFKQCRKLRPEVNRPVWIESLRAADGEVITKEQWNELATGHMKAIGLDPDKHMHTIFQHPQENHIHIVASRIAIDGSLYLGKNENLIASKDCRRIEKKYNLQQLPDKPNQPRKHLTKNEIEMKNRTGELPPREKLQGIISKSLADRPTQPVFEKRLVDAGVSFKKSTGGYSYEIEGVAFKGSQLGKDYKQSAIQSKIAPPIITPPPVVEVKIKLPPTPIIVPQVQPVQVQKTNPLIAKPDVQPVRAFMSEANAPTTALNENKPTSQQPAVDVQPVQLTMTGPEIKTVLYDESCRFRKLEESAKAEMKTFSEKREDVVTSLVYRYVPEWSKHDEKAEKLEKLDNQCQEREAAWLRVQKEKEWKYLPPLLDDAGKMEQFKRKTAYTLMSKEQLDWQNEGAALKEWRSKLDPAKASLEQERQGLQAKTNELAPQINREADQLMTRRAELRTQLNQAQEGQRQISKVYQNFPKGDTQYQVTGRDASSLIKDVKLLEQIKQQKELENTRDMGHSR